VRALSVRAATKNRRRRRWCACARANPRRLESGVAAHAYRRRSRVAVGERRWCGGVRQRGFGWDPCAVFTSRSSSFSLID
jgi:hypothetical protein